MKSEFFLMVLPFILSLFINILMIKLSYKFNFFLDDINKKHGSHKKPTPRIGGLGIYLSFGMVSLFLGKTAVLLWISAMPVFFVGFLEDLKRDILPKKRMLVMAAGVILSIALLNAVITDIWIAELPLFLAIPFTVFAIVGITNAINMIDGYNGLASGISFSFLFFMSILMYQLKDFEILFILAAIGAAILGFFVLNFPSGKIFLGDSGAYTLGFFIGVLSAVILQRHPEISPWVPVMFLAYPIFDVLFSIFRRVFIQKTSPFSPDKLHFHSLVNRKITKNNPLTSVFVIFLSIPFSFLAFNFHNKEDLLPVIFLTFAFLYIFLYFFLIDKDFFVRNNTKKLEIY